MQKKLLTKFNIIYDFKKTLQKVGIEETYPSIIKAIYDKPTAESFSSKIRNKTRMPTRATFIKLVLEFLATPFRQENEIKGIHIRKEEV